MIKKSILMSGSIALFCAGVAFFVRTDSKEAVQELLKKADITINGDRPWDIVVHNEQLYDRVLQQGSLGLGEAYMDGW